MNLNRIYRLLKIALYGKPIPFAVNLSKLKGSSNESLINLFDFKSKYLVHKPSNQKLSQEYFNIFEFDLSLINFYLTSYSITPNSNKSFILSDRGTGKAISVMIDSHHTLQLYREIFIYTPYAFSCSEDCVVMDVGMNIGFASLFFASKKHVKSVYGYELVPNTYQKSSLNFNLNPALAAKVNSFGFGLGNMNAQLSIPYVPPGSVGASIYDFMIDHISSNQKKTSVLIKDIQEEILAIYDKNKLPIVLKLDCEGAEYDIIQRLYEQQLFRFIKTIMIEWHVKGPDQIINQLIDRGFDVFSNLIPAHMPMGFIYGVNRSYKNV